MGLRAYRTSKNLSQKLLGRILGYSQETISRWENFGAPQHILEKLEIRNKPKILDKERNNTFYLGGMVRAQREVMELTQSDLAELFNVDDTTVSRIESGKIRLSPRLKRTIDEFIGLPVLNLAAFTLFATSSGIAVAAVDEEGGILHSNTLASSLFTKYLTLDKRSWQAVTRRQVYSGRSSAEGLVRVRRSKSKLTISSDYAVAECNIVNASLVGHGRVSIVQVVSIRIL